MIFASYFLILFAWIMAVEKYRIVRNNLDSIYARRGRNAAQEKEWLKKWEVWMAEQQAAHALDGEADSGAHVDRVTEPKHWSSTRRRKARDTDTRGTSEDKIFVWDSLL